LTNSTTIFWFSGSGNSLAVARSLERPLQAKLVAVGSSDHPGAETPIVGFVFPVYDFKAPKVVEELVGRMPLLEHTHVFAVCTYGLAAGQSLRRLDKILRARAGSLMAGFAVRMPHNGIGSHAAGPSQDRVLIDKWNQRVDAVAGIITSRMNGPVETTSAALSFLRPDVLAKIPLVVRFLFRIMTKGIGSLALIADHHCDGCGICARVCPVRNIEIDKGKPVWGDRCAVCFGCLHWCPREAISCGGARLGIRHYHHPDIKLSDMVRRPLASDPVRSPGPRQDS
jgi:Pyruvate/2-oxoacid:ferredoxin oxidoreductase delta subunit